MDIIIPPDLHLQVRKIRNIEVWKSDLLPLIVGGEKIPSTPINAYCALLQDSAEGCPNYIIFSSWQKDDEIVSFSLAQPSIYLYIVPSLPGSGKIFFWHLSRFWHRSHMLHVTPLSDIADLRPDWGVSDGRTFIGASGALVRV